MFLKKKREKNENYPSFNYWENKNKMECENTDGQRPSVFGPETFSSTCILDMCTSKKCTYVCV